jgi:hypothetical protein
MPRTFDRNSSNQIRAFKLSELKEAGLDSAFSILEREMQFRIDCFDEDGLETSCVLDYLDECLLDLGALDTGKSELHEGRGNYPGHLDVSLSSAEFAASKLATAIGDAELANAFDGAVLRIEDTTFHYYGSRGNIEPDRHLDATLTDASHQELVLPDECMVRLCRPIWAAMDEAADGYNRSRAGCEDEEETIGVADERERLYCAAGCCLGEASDYDPENCVHSSTYLAWLHDEAS